MFPTELGARVQAILPTASTLTFEPAGDSRARLVRVSAADGRVLWQDDPNPTLFKCSLRPETVDAPAGVRGALRLSV